MRLFLEVVVEGSQLGLMLYLLIVEVVVVVVRVFLMNGVSVVREKGGKKT